MVNSNTNPFNGKNLTNLFGQHVPFELWQVFHRPDVISEPRALLPSNGRRVQHGCDRPCDLFILELDPSLSKMGFFRRRVFASEICPLCIWIIGRANSIRGYMDQDVGSLTFLLQIHLPHLTVLAHQMSDLGGSHARWYPRDVDDPSFLFYGLEGSESLGR